MHIFVKFVNPKYLNIMRTLVHKLFFATALLLLFSACEKQKKDDVNNNNSGEYPSSTLTPGQHQEKLEQTAISFVNEFNAKDIEALLNSVISLSEYIEDFPYLDEAERLNLNRLAQGIERFSAADITAFATRAAEEFIIDINDPEINVFAGKCFTYADDVWTETDGAEKTIAFKWDESEATLSWAGSTTVEYLYAEDNVNYVVYVPNNIVISIKVNGVEQLNITLKTNITDIKTWAPSVTITLNGGYVFTSEVKGNNKGLEAHRSIAKRGKTLTATTAVVAINDFTDIDNWFATYYDEENGESYTEIDPSVYFLDNVKSGRVQVDILNISMIAEGDLRNMYETIENYGERYDSDKLYYENVCRLINDKVKVVVVYNDTKQKIADVIVRVYEEEYYGDKYYFIEPILLFPDGSKFAFDKYFTEKAFGDLLEEIQQLVDDFATL